MSKICVCFLSFSFTLSYFMLYVCSLNTLGVDWAHKNVLSEVWRVCCLFVSNWTILTNWFWLNTNEYQLIIVRERLKLHWLSWSVTPSRDDCRLLGWFQWFLVHWIAFSSLTLSPYSWHVSPTVSLGTSKTNQQHRLPEKLTNQTLSF
jgi:hypothetical protein